MAAPPFPQRKSSGSGSTSNPISEQMDGPPPSPAFPQGGQVSPGQQTPFPSMGQMSAPMTAGTPSAATSPEILQGLVQGMTAIEGMWDSMASVVPAFAADFAMLKDLQQRLMAKLAVNGAQPMATALGNNFPGGGFDRGVQ